MAGQLWLWGNNGYGNLGDNTNINKSSPVQTVTFATNWSSLFTGFYHVGAIKTDGTLWLWGRNLNGTLGDNTTTQRSSPVQTIVGGINWSKVACGPYNTAAIKTDGTLWIWGSNSNGQLGDNTLTDRSSPVQTVTGGTNWSVVACGRAHTAAIKTDGTLWTWGSNSHGQLGDNTLTNKSSPIQTITGGNNWSSVACGYNFVAAIKTDGTLWLWGQNTVFGAAGQLGDNTGTNKSSPVQTIAGGNNWSSVACGRSHTAALKRDGTLWTWGLNSYGNLGDNTSIRKSSPIQTISAGNNWSFVACGYQHTTATKTDGSLWAWGRNNDGQLGDNTLANKSSPIQTVMVGNRWFTVGGGYSTAAIYENTASALSITTQPANAYNAQKILNQPVVAVVDSSGAIVTTSQAVITATIASGTPSLTGTTNILVSGGVAQFTDLTLSGLGSGSLIFTASGLTSAISSYVAVEQSSIAIVPKRTETSGRIPYAEQLRNGELAINLADKKGYVKNSSGSIVNVFTGLGADVITSGMIGENAVNMRDIAPGAVGPSELASGVIGGTNTQILYNSSGGIAGTAAFTLSTTSGVVTIAPQNAGYNALTLRSFTSQTADLLKVQNSAGTDVARITSSGEWVGPLGSGNIVSGYIASGQIGINHLASGVISTAALGSGQVASGSIASGSVGQFKLSSGAVNSGHIGNNAVVSGSIASGSIGNFHLASGAVTSGEIGNAAVVSGSIASGSVGTVHIASGSITSDLIASGAIINADVADNAVTSGKIASGTIGVLHISSGGVQNVNIASGAVLSGNIASGQIGINHLASGAASAAAVAGISGQIQFNAGGLLGASSAITFSSGTAHLNVTAQSTNIVPIRVSVNSGHTANSFEIYNSGTLQSYIRANGGFFFQTNGTYEHSKSVVSMDASFTDTVLIRGVSNTNSAGTNSVVIRGYGAGSAGNVERADTRALLVGLRSGDAFSVQGTGRVAIGATYATNSPAGTTDYRGILIVENSIGIKQTFPSGSLHVSTGSAGIIGVIVQGATSQTANLQEWQNSAGVVYARINASGEFFGLIASGVVTSGSIASGSIGNFHLASGAVTSGDIGNAAVVSGSIASGSVGTFHIASGSITSELIASGAVINADVADNAVTSGKIASGSIGTMHISSGGVQNVNIASGAVTSGNIASGSIGSFHIASGAVTSGEIGNASVVSGSIASGTIGLFHFASGQVAAGGANSQVQYNSSGALAGAAAMSYSTTSPHVTIQAQNAAYTPLVVKGTTSQTADLLQLQTSTGYTPFAFNVSGQATMTMTNSLGVPISMRLLDDTYGTISWEGSLGQLFSISNNMTGIIFSVNDISGIPSIDVNSDGTVRLAQYAGNVGIRKATPSGLLDVGGDAIINGLTVGRGSSNSGDITNSAFGFNAHKGVYSGAYNVAIGWNALAIASGTGVAPQGLTAIGAGAMGAATTAYNSTAVGHLAGYAMNSAYNTALGMESLYGTGGLFNTAVGNRSMYATAGYSRENIAVGYESLRLNTGGSYNVALGVNAAYTATTAGNVVAVGYQALYNNTASGNVAVGFQAGYNTTGVGNTYLGYKASFSQTGGINNTAIGYESLLNTGGGNHNTAVGYRAAYSIGTADGNTAFGFEAMLSSIGGASVAIGYRSLRENISGLQNISIGTSALQNNFGSFNVGIGNSALQASATTGNNVAVGYQALYSNTASGNVAVGALAAYNNTSGTGNVAVGRAALNANTIGSFNTAINEALQSQTIASYNVGIGYGALNSTTVGGYNTAIGGQALALNQASGNVAVGFQASYANTTGFRNISIGYQAGYSNTTGSGNIAIGFQALYTPTTGGNNIAIGELTLYANTTGYHNVAIGVNTMAANTIGAANTAVGQDALVSNTRGDLNQAFGRQALYSNTSGSSNCAFGSTALRTNTLGNNNVAVGNNALYNNTTSANTAVGTSALYSNTTGSGNMAVGYTALYNNTTGNANVAIGYQAAFASVTGEDCVAIGNNALRSATVGYRNVAIGNFAMYSHLAPVNSEHYGQIAIGYEAAYTASGSPYFVAIGYQAAKAMTGGAQAVTAVGYKSLTANTTGGNNSAFGTSTLATNTTGYSNTAIGAYSLLANTTGIQNTAVGEQSLYSNTTGNSNTAIGLYASYYNTTGSNNTSLGKFALYANQSGNNMVAVGFEALYNNTIGSGNTAIGYQALKTSASGSLNTAIGYQAATATTTGIANTIVGAEALGANTVGNSNVAIGNVAGYYQADGATALQSGNNSIYIGNSCRGFNNADSNSIVIGYQAIGQGANTTVIGTSSTVSGTIYGNINFPIGIRVNTGSSTQKGIVVQGAASQTANLTEWQNNTGTNLAYMDASGNFYAVSKSFYIDHPTKPGKKLRHVCVEAPSADVYFRGKSNSNMIDLPDYWSGLVDFDTITVMLTPVGKKQDLYFEKIENNKVYVGGDENPVFNFVIFGERKDIPKVVIED